MKFTHKGIIQRTITRAFDTIQIIKRVKLFESDGLWVTAKGERFNPMNYGYPNFIPSNEFSVMA